MTARARSRYDAALARFFRYLAAWGLPLPRSKVELDGRAAAYVQYLYDAGAPRPQAPPKPHRINPAARASRAPPPPNKNQKKKKQNKIKK